MRYTKTIVCAVVTGCTVIGFCIPLFSTINFNQLLQRGIRSLTEDYDAIKARQNFKEILDEPDANEEIIIHSYFWMAYSYLFEGRNDDARVMFKKMFEYKTDPDYKYESVLNQALISNGELMRLYDVEFERFYGRPRIIIDKDKAGKRRFKAEKKFVMRALILGGIIVTVIIMSLL